MNGQTVSAPLALEHQLAEAQRRAETFRRVTEWISSELALQPLLTRIVESAVQLIGAQYGSIGLVASSSGGPVVQIAAISNMPAHELGAQIPAGVGLAGRVLATQHAVIAERYGDLDQPTLPELAEHAVIGVPIWWGERMIGFFGIGSEPPRSFGPDDAHTLGLLARHAAIAIENARLFEAQRRRATRIGVINQIGRLITSSLNLQQVFQTAVDAIHHQLGFAYVAAGLVDPDDHNMLALYAHTGLHVDQVPPHYRQPIGEGIVGAAARTRQRVLVNDVYRDKRYLALLRSNMIQAELAVPIQVDGTLLGVLNIESEQPISEQDAEGVGIVADQLAIAIVNARRYEQEQQRTARLELIARLGQRIAARLDTHEMLIATTNELHHQLGYDHVSLFLIDQHDPAFLVQHAHASAWPRPDEIGYRQPITRGILGAAAQRRRPELVPDVQHDDRYVPIPGAPANMAELAMPIIHDDTLLGVLDIASRKPLSAEDVTALQIVAGQLAITIDNARRYAAEKQRSARLQLIAHVGQRIAARLDPDELLATTADDLHTRIGYDHVSIFLLDSDDPQWLVQRARASRWPRSVPGGYRQAISDGVMGAAARARRPELVNDVRADKRYIPAPRATDLRAELAMPIVLDDRLFGILDVASTQTFDDEDVTGIRIIADQLAVSLDNAQRYAAEKQRSARLQLIARVGQRIAARLEPDALFRATVEELHHQLGYDHAAIFLLDPDDPTWLVKRSTVSRWAGKPPGYRQSIMRGLMGAAARQRQAVLANDVWADPRFVPVLGGDDMRAELATPILLGDRLLGVLDVASVRMLSTEDVTALQIVADQLAIAIDNAQLFTDTQHALATTQLLYGFSRHASTALDTDAVIAAYLDQVAARGQYECLVVLNADDRATGVMHGRWTPQGGAEYLRRPFSYEPSISATLATGQSVLIADTTVDPRTSMDDESLDAGALAFIPLIVRTQWIGTVVLCDVRPRAWNAADLEIYQATASQLATALDSRQQQVLLAQRGQQLAVLEERHRLARELHDSVTQQLFSMTLLAQALAPAWRRDPQQGEQRVERLLDISQRALAEMRALLIELQPPSATEAAVPAHSSAAYVREAGLAAALERHIADLARDGLQVAIDTAGYLPQHQDHEAALYRIAQEALANVAKHAGTTRAELRLWTIDDRTLLRIKDHGRGFQRPSDSASTDPHSSPHGTFGLRSMRERAQALGGTLRIDAAPGQGTTIEASIPRNDR